LEIFSANYSVSILLKLEGCKAEEGVKVAAMARDVAAGRGVHRGRLLGLNLVEEAALHQKGSLIQEWPLLFQRGLD
jgi:hypothetical protein